MKGTHQINNLQELGVFAQQIIATYTSTSEGSLCIALHGDLGVGKTAFVKEVAKVLGVKEEVTSPTFVVMRSYEVEGGKFEHLIHIDAYRIEHSDDLIPLRFDEVVGAANSVICIEWPENAGNHLPKNTLHLTISLEQEDVRRIDVSGEVVS